MAYTKRGRKGARRPRRVGKARKARGKQLVTKNQMYRAIRQNIETKRVSHTVSPTYFNSGITQENDFYRLIPATTQGLNQNNRVGVRIKPLSLTIRGYLAYNTNINTVPAPYGAKMIVARLVISQNKAQRTHNMPVTNFRLLDGGGGGTTFTGATNQLNLPMNTDEFNFFANKKYTMLKPYGITNSLSPSATTSVVSMNNTLYRPFVIKLTQKHLPAQLIYDDSTQYPVNFAPYLSVGYADVFNSSPDVVNTQVLAEWTSTLEYEDA